jgi:hypothetical protein
LAGQVLSKPAGKRFKMHPKTVIRKFRGRLGVVEVGSDETLHKRKWKFMKISKAAVARFVAENGTRTTPTKRSNFAHIL